MYGTPGDSDAHYLAIGTAPCGQGELPRDSELLRDRLTQQACQES